MKYKNIHSALHNYVHSFKGGTNYFEDVHILEIITNEVRKSDSQSLTINLTTGEINPAKDYHQALIKSSKWYADNFADHLKRHNIDPSTIKDPRIHVYLDLRGLHYQIEADDDRGKEYAIEPA